MSEFQSYEFRAVDQPLTDKQMAELRRYSSRAEISSTGFSVDYAYGDFKGEPAKWMERYFDAFLYKANWGTRELMLRLPAHLLPLETARAFRVEGCVSARVAGGQVVVGLCSQEEDGGEWIEPGGGDLDALLPLREELASGDLRPLYLAWLRGVEQGELDQADPEPPCPPGLGALSSAQEALVDLLELDRDLVAAAAEASSKREAEPAGDEVVRRWVASLEANEKDALLVRVLAGDSQLRPELLRRCREALRPANGPASASAARSVAELLARAEQQAELRLSGEAKREARAEAARVRREAKLREVELSALAEREAEVWGEIDELVGARKGPQNARAVELLRDLRDLSLRDGWQARFLERLERIRLLHDTKSSFLRRLSEAKLTAKR